MNTSFLTRPISGPQASPETLTATVSRWRTTLSLTLRGASEQTSEASLQSFLNEEADHLETAISRFRTDSELSRVNRAPGQWHEVSKRFAEVLSAAIAAAGDTAGLVDPTLGTWVDAAGYRRWRDGEPFQKGTDTIAIPQPQAHWAQIDIRPGRTRPEIRIPIGCELDLGALGKAWLADHIAQHAASMWNTDVLANMGGDLRAIGSTEPWLVGSDPDIPGFDPAALLVSGTGLATSGQGKRRWSTSQGTAHHIIDPRTGKSARSRWWTVSVLADTAISANTAATAALILDCEGPNWLKERGLDAWLVDWDSASSSAPSATTTGRWPKECQVAA
jgi:thiamine biosynthesis lipoprotein